MLFLLIGTCNLYATTRYVKPLATGNGSGSSWANASDDLQAMIDASSSGNADQVFVAAGTYKPIRRADNTSIITPNDRDNAFVLKRNIKVYGGYPVTGTPFRDIVANPTILSGDIGVLNDNTDNCYHVVVFSGAIGTGRLDGFIVRAGNANETTQITVNGEAIPRGHGGGIYHTNDYQNSSTSGSINLYNCSIEDNMAIKGGGIYNGGFYKANCYMYDCSLINNTATNGGGIYNGGYLLCDFKAERTVFINNTATEDGGGFSNGDDNNLGYFRIDNSNFISNIAYNGGAVYNAATNPSESDLNNCNFIENIANEGSSVYTTNNVFPSDLIILNCIIWGNNVTNGDLVNNGGSLNVSYSIIENGYTGTANSDLDPLFTDAPNGDFSLQVSSPAINMGYNIYGTGGNIVDLAGNNRVIGPTVDAGAYESPYGVITPDNQGIVYVNKNVVGGNRNGNSWLMAAPELADALVAAKANPAITQIWVAQGTYNPLYCPATSDLGAIQVRDNAFSLVNNVKLYGGFQNANETNINQRDTLNLNTILSGDRSGDNFRHVVISSGPIGTACLNGFTIRDGYAGSITLSEPGSIYVDGAPISKSHGAGIYIRGSELTIKNCDFINNRASSAGGGIYIAYSPTLTITNCRIIDNIATLFGGGIFNGQSSPLIENCTISGNSVVAGEGGGLYTVSTMSTIPNISTNIRNSVISGNTADDGGGIYLKSRMTVLLTNCTVADNSGTGAIYGENNTNSSVEFHNTLLWDNATGLEMGTGNNTYTSFYSLIQDKNDFPANGNLDGTNLSNDPLFSDVAGENFTLLPCSPAINIGSNSEYTLMGGDLALDMDASNNPRLFEGTIDMGAYELQIPTVSQIVPTFTQIAPICSGSTLSLPTLSDNGISGTWSPAPNNSQTTSYTFTPTPAPCVATGAINMTVTVNPLDDANFSYSTNNICTENINILPSSIATVGGAFSSQQGLIINAATGEIDVAASQTGTYTITYTTAQSCTNASNQTFTIMDLPDATFTYSEGNYCTSTINASPNVTGSIGSFSAAPAGLSINSSTGVINISTSSAGVYVITNLIPASGNCPADAEMVNLSVETSPVATISLSNGTLAANEVNGAFYQWINCSNQNPIQGEIESTFTPAVGGSYAVIVTSGNCSTTSDCETMSPLGIKGIVAEMVKIYPNPANETLYISSSIPVNVTITAMDGKIVKSVKNAEKIDLTTVANSIYTVRITDNDGTLLKVERIVVNK